MEAGESPARSRHCNEGVLPDSATAIGKAKARPRGKAGRALIAESGDMHKSLAELCVTSGHAGAGMKS